MAAESKNLQRVAVSKMAVMREERARDAALAMREYEAERLAVLAKTGRLRALRLAQDAVPVLHEKK
jgi:Mg/Co/Ni transporter MgtE